MDLLEFYITNLIFDHKIEHHNAQNQRLFLNIYLILHTGLGAFFTSSIHLFFLRFFLLFIFIQQVFLESKIFSICLSRLKEAF